MFSDVLFHLLTDVLKMCSDDLRSSDMFSEDHKCWILDFLQIFSRCSLNILRIFPGFSQDVLMGLVSVVGLGGLVWSFGSSRSGGSCGSCGSSGFGGSCESDWLGGSGSLVGIFFLFDLIQKYFKWNYCLL